MADWIVSIVLEKLNTILQDEVARLLGVNDKFEDLSRMFTSIQGFLEDAESRRLKDEAVKIWVEKVKDVAYDVDDMLEWTMEALISQAQMMEAQRSQEPAGGDGSSFSKKTVRSFFSPVTSFNQFVLRHKIGYRLKETRKRLDSIVKEASQLSLKFLSREEGKREIEERETSPLFDRTAIVGREEDKKKILDLLLTESSEEVNEVPFVIISIVGMGGLGKTTLAQLVYNDERVIGHFDMRIWVVVPVDFDLKQITKSIIESADSQFNGEHLGFDQLQHRLHGMLHGKRFLLVLDDVWNDDSEKWERLSRPFKAGALGSRIIVTTRSVHVARMMGSTFIHKLHFLSDDDCWLLFSRKALEHRSAEERLELEEIGRKIVNKCGGLPLAAKTIAGAMASRRTRREWELVLESDLWYSSDILGGILPNLLLSYRELPLALKQCFIYCSIFPRDWRLEKDTMVKLWVAQGFIRSYSYGSTDLEEIGELYFDDLLKRSLLQDEELDDNKKLLSCKMHDLVYDLAISMAGSDYSVVDIRNQASLKLNHIRHSFLIGSHEADEVASIWPTLYTAHKLRTLLRDAKISKVPGKVFRRLKYLRVLDLSRNDMKKFPRTVPQLIHLRYLDLSYTGIEKLPAWVCDCGNLQTLRLNGCDSLHKLPRGMRKMRSLRHLELKCHLTIDSTHHLRYLPQGIGSLTSLRTLTDFIVGGDDEGCKCGELKQLNNLCGRLQIIGLESVGSSEEAMEAELDKKQHLKALSLQYDYRRGEPLGDDVKKAEDVLESLRPNANLEGLDIWCYQGSKLPKWIEDLSNLVQVNLIYCCKFKQLPGLGKLPSLKYLTIRGMKEVRYVGDKFSGDNNNDGSGGFVSFPKLETLIFSEMPNWEEWELRGGDGKVMPSLLQLEINDCTKLKALPWNLPPSIQKLTLNISNDGMSSGGPLPVLPFLKNLVISRSPDLTSLPCAWLGKLEALQRLEIHRCPRLRSLSLPEELQHLTRLQELKIEMCPLLEKCCQDAGEYWDKIAHIPNISIGHHSYQELVDLNDPAQ